MNMTITITDDAGNAPVITTAPSHTAGTGGVAPAADAGAAPVGATTSGVAANDFPGGGGADGGAAPEWLRELLGSDSVRGGATTISDPALPAVDAGAAPAAEQ